MRIIGVSLLLTLCSADFQLAPEVMPDVIRAFFEGRVESLPLSERNTLRLQCVRISHVQVNAIYKAFCDDLACNDATRKMLPSSAACFEKESTLALTLFSRTNRCAHPNVMSAITVAQCQPSCPMHDVLPQKKRQKQDASAQLVCLHGNFTRAGPSLS